MTKLAIVGMAVLIATSAMAADLPLKRAAPQPEPNYPAYPPQAQAPMPMPPPMPQGFPPPMPFAAGPPPVNPCVVTAGVFPPPLPFLGLGLGRGLFGGHHR